MPHETVYVLGNKQIKRRYFQETINRSDGLERKCPENEIENETSPPRCSVVHAAGDAKLRQVNIPRCASPHLIRCVFREKTKKIVDYKPTTKSDIATGDSTDDISLNYFNNVLNLQKDGMEPKEERNDSSQNGDNQNDGKAPEQNIYDLGSGGDLFDRNCLESRVRNELPNIVAIDVEEPKGTENHDGKRDTAVRIHAKKKPQDWFDVANRSEEADEIDNWEDLFDENGVIEKELIPKVVAFIPFAVALC